MAGFSLPAVYSMNPDTVSVLSSGGTTHFQGCIALDVAAPES